MMFRTAVFAFSADFMWSTTYAAVWSFGLAGA